MSQLRTLTLDRNPLNDADLSEQTFAGLDKSLESLSLNSAGLILWSKNSMSALNQLHSLRGLKLNGNSGLKSPESALELTKLNSLELQNSNLDELPHFLCQLESLTDLDVSSNRIRSVQSSCGLIQIGTSSRLKHLNLNNNPLECDCRLREVKIWLTGTYERDLLELIKWECAKPERLKGKMLVNIPIRDLSCPKTTSLPDPSIVVIQPAEETKPTTRSSTTTQIQSTQPLNSTFIPRIISTHPNSTTIIISWLVVAIGLGILIVLTLILITLYLVCIRSRERGEKERYVKEYLFGSQIKELSPSGHLFSLSSSSSSTTTNGSVYTKSSNLDLVDIFGSEYFSGILPAEAVQKQQHVYDKPLNSVLSSRTNQRRLPSGHQVDSHVYHEIGGSEPIIDSNEIFYVRKNLSYINNDNYLIQPEQTASTTQQQLEQYNSLRFIGNNSSFGFVKMNSFNEGLIV